MHIKSTVRGGNNKNYWSKWTNPHSSLIKFRSCSSSGEFVNSQTPFIDPPDYKYAFIKHYYKKSFEEFCIKIKRGWPDLTDKDYIKNNYLLPIIFIIDINIKYLCIFFLN